ncbi:MAG: hypothetical protein HY078_02460 [Elusimicrobia bacterium]|nr:hypothetical protein [Elusimicrobiota bacterium]
MEYDNTNSRYFMLSAWVDYGRLDIEPYKTETIDVSVHDGKTYSNKSIGLPLLAAPAYWVARRLPPISRDAPLSPRSRYLTRLAAVTLPFALAGALLLRLMIRLGASPRDACLASLAYGFGTIAWIHGTLFSGHETAAAAGLASFYLSWSTAESKGRSVRRWAAAGALAALPALCDSASVALSAALAGYGFWKIRNDAGRGRARAAFAAGLCVPAAALAVYNARCFGAPWAFSYGHLAPGAFGARANAGLFGVNAPDPKALLALLVSPWRGVFFLMPVLLLGLPALIGRRLPRAEAVWIRGLVAGYFILNASYFGWHGGWTFGPRYLVPMLPFLALPVAFNARTWWFPLLFALSAAQVALAQAVMPHTPEVSWNHVVEVLLPLARYGYWSKNIGTWLGLGEPLSLIAFAAVAAAAAWKLLPRRTPASRPSPPPAWHAVFGAAALGIVGSIALLRSPGRWPAILHACKGHLLANAAYQLRSQSLLGASRYENSLSRDERRPPPPN